MGQSSFVESVGLLGGLSEAAVRLFWGRSRADCGAGAVVKAWSGCEHCFGAGYNLESGPEWLWGREVTMGLLWGRIRMMGLFWCRV